VLVDNSLNAIITYLFESYSNIPKEDIYLSYYYIYKELFIIKNRALSYYRLYLPL